MALVEGAAARVLSAETHVSAGFHQAGKGQSFGHAVVDGALARAHLGALFEQLLHFRMNVEALGIGGETSGELGNLVLTRVRFRLRIPGGRGRRSSCSNTRAVRASAACA